MFIEGHRLSVFQPRGTDVSVILDLMIHNLDLILHLIKSTVTKVSASGVAVLSHTPDIANARIEFANGAGELFCQPDFAQTNAENAHFSARPLPESRFSGEKCPDCAAF